VAFVDGLLSDAAFVEDVARFTALIDPHGASNALGQCLIKLAAPGVPDFYQGAEVWHQRLVDPDNRGPVDFAALRGRLGRLREDPRPAGERASALLDRYVDGDIKLLVTACGLDLRRKNAALFAEGDYVPLEGEPHALAFARTRPGSAPVLALATRLPRTLLVASELEHAQFCVGAVWRGRRIRMPRVLAGDYEDVLTGETVAVNEHLPLERAFARLPIALLRRRGPA
jgi:(1->4)-alpha-D-glucan 1-alpha-D-glucosylmutase